MAAILIGLVATLLAAAYANTNTCNIVGDLTKPVPQEWITIKNNTECHKALTHQVKTELEASMSYLAMAAHFSRETINRPGFAEMFFKSASEEREHAMKILEYLLMRGDTFDKLEELIQNPKPVAIAKKPESGYDALKAALKLETSVTESIRSIIVKCEDPDLGFNDYHLVDYLTGDFLTEQYEGQRHIAGLTSTLSKMMRSHGEIGEFLFDKQLLEKK